MKKILSLLVLLVAFTACEEDVQFNNPAVQGLKDNQLWRASEYTAVMGSDNSLMITAKNGFEILTLRTASVDAGQYVLGVNEVNKAAYVLSADGIEDAYQTGTNIGDGQITISNDGRETDVARGYISGKFYFNAVNDEGQIVNFQEGVFYKIPITSMP